MFGIHFLDNLKVLYDHLWSNSFSLCMEEFACPEEMLNLMKLLFCQILWFNFHCVHFKISLQYDQVHAKSSLENQRKPSLFRITICKNEWCTLCEGAFIRKDKSYAYLPGLSGKSSGTKLSRTFSSSSQRQKIRCNFVCALTCSMFRALIQTKQFLNYNKCAERQDVLLTPRNMWSMYPSHTAFIKRWMSECSDRQTWTPKIKSAIWRPRS